MAKPEFYRAYGKTYKTGSHYEVNGSHALEDIQEYVKGLPKDAVVFPRGPETEVPYASVQDYICTLRRACRPDGPFVWPHESMRFERAIAVAAHHLPPGYAMCIQNGRPIPSNLRGGGRMSEAAPVGGGRMSEATGSTGEGTQAQKVPPAFARSAPAGQSGTHYFAWNEGTSGEPQLHDDAGVFWHGTSVHALPHIVAEGFRPSLGAGAEQVMSHYALQFQECMSRRRGTLHRPIR